MGGVASFVSYPISKPSVLTGTKLAQICCIDYGELSNSFWFYLITGFVSGYVHTIVNSGHLSHQHMAAQYNKAWSC